MEINIDNKSGFCRGVIHAINTAEEHLQNSKNELFCIGQIVHNEEEVNRLEHKGLKTIDKNQLKSIKNKDVLIRAHGEPPETYDLIKKNNNRIIDSTCTVVLHLQQKVKKAYLEMTKIGGQVIIFGKAKHPEVIGLIGQTKGNAILITDIEDLKQINFTLPIRLFSQTTQDLSKFQFITESIKIECQKNKNSNYQFFDTICRQVSNRVNDLKKFVSKHDINLFISGKHSSNGKYLFDICKQQNPNTHFIYDLSSIKDIDFRNSSSIGICGATSTPHWLMEKAAGIVNNEIE